MMEHFLNIGDVVAAKGLANYTCFGLGSCIGLFIQDRVKGLSAGAHIFLPEDEGVKHDANKFYGVTSALDEIARQLKLYGSNLNHLSAKVVGGANVIAMRNHTGEKNAESVIHHLTARKIFIAAVDVGGIHSRTAKFQGNTGQLTVRILQTNEKKLY